MSIFDIRLTLTLADQRKQLTNPMFSSNQVINCTNSPNINVQQSFETIFTKEQVNALEEYRRSGDLALNLGLRALTSLSGDTISSYDLSDMIIPREQWLNALKNAGFRFACQSARNYTIKSVFLHALAELMSDRLWVGAQNL